MSQDATKCLGLVLFWLRPCLFSPASCLGILPRYVHLHVHTKFEKRHGSNDVV